MSQVIGTSNGQMAQPINLWATVKVSFIQYNALIRH